MKMPVNITNAEELEASGLVEGDPIHLGIVGPGVATNDAVFQGRLIKGDKVTGIRLKIRGKDDSFEWMDIMELWPLPASLCFSGPHKSGVIHHLQEKLGASN